MAMTALKKNERIDLRVSLEEKTKLRKAVEFCGERMSDFILKRVMPDVDRLLAAEQRIKLNQEAWEGFVSLLNSQKPASPSLKRAMQEYRDIRKV
jgi:uncharacterized protein (DUF1778 family)